MHEAGIVDEMVHELLHRLEGMGSGGRVVKVYVRLGRGSHLTRESFTMLFEGMARGTRLEGARVVVIPAPGRAITIDTFETE